MPGMGFVFPEMETEWWRVIQPPFSEGTDKFVSKTRRKLGSWVCFSREFFGGIMNGMKKGTTREIIIMGMIDQSIGKGIYNLCKKEMNANLCVLLGC